MRSERPVQTENSASTNADAPIRVFLNYRKEDSGEEGSGKALPIHQALARRFGDKNVFRDIASLRPGRRWDEVIDAELERSHAIIVLIGKRWLTLKVEDGTGRRLHDPEDRLRREIESALEHRLAVFPVLVAGALMPKMGQLPGKLKQLCDYQAQEVADRTFNNDMERLIESIEAVAEEELKAGAVEEADRQPEEQAGQEPEERAEQQSGEQAEDERRSFPAEAAVAEVSPARDTRAPAPQGALRGDFGDAEQIAGVSGTTRGDSTAATKEPGEPDHAGNAGGKSVWYRWTAPSDGTTTINTFGSDFDTLLAVYRGSGVTELEQVAANDDASGTTQSRVTFPVTEGAEYRIAVDGYGGAAGAIVLNWEWRAPSSNNDFSQAEEIAGARGTTHGNNAAATKEPGEPDHAGNAGGRSVWYRWTAPDGGVAVIDTVGSDFDTLLAVYRGSSVTGLQPVVANDDADGRQSRVTFPVTEGNEYRIAIDGYGGAAGEIVLNWEVGVTDLPALVEATGLTSRPAGDGRVAVPFTAERAVESVVVQARELSQDGVAFFSVPLPEPKPNRKREKALYNLMRVSFTADYVKAIVVDSGLAFAAEVPVALLTPAITEGLIRGIVHLGDVRGSDLVDWQGWEARLGQCAMAQAVGFDVDRERASQEARATLAGAGSEVREPQPGYLVTELEIGGSPLKAAVRLRDRATSLLIYFGDLKPRGREYFEHLLELNRMANVAKVGIDQDGDIALMYEVPRLLPEHLEHAKSQLASLAIGLAAVEAAAS